MKLSSQFVRNGVHRWTALFFALVVAAFGVVQVAHTHGFTEDANVHPAAHCTMCAASHSVAVTSEISLAPVLSFQPGTILVAEPQLESQLNVFTAFTRPPPAAL